MEASLALDVPDEELVHRAQRGELAAFEALLNRYQDRVYSLAYRILEHPEDAEDATQQTFLSVLENLDTFRGDSSFKTWLFRIATHAAFAVLRRRRGLSTTSLEALLDGGEDEETPLPLPTFIADWRENPERLLERAETRRLIEGALQELPEKYRLVFLLRDVEGLSTRETAHLLGITEANVKVRLLRARLMLREKLTRLFGDEGRVVMARSKDEM